MTVAELLEGLAGGGQSRNSKPSRSFSIGRCCAFEAGSAGPAYQTGCEFNDLASGPLCLKNFRSLLLSSRW